MALGGMALAGAASAQGAAGPGAPAPAPTPTPTASAPRFVSDGPLAQIFSTFCLKAFPDPAALDAALRIQSQSPMTAEQAKAYLPDGAGRAWLVRTSDSLFALAVGDPPYQTCQVRQMTPDGVRDIGALMAAIKTHVTAIKGTLVVVAPDKASPQGGPEIRYFGFGVVTADSVPVEQFGVYVSDYKGKAAEPWTPFAGRGSGVEVRYTRTILAS